MYIETCVLKSAWFELWGHVRGQDVKKWLRVINRLLGMLEKEWRLITGCGRYVGRFTDYLQAIGGIREWLLTYLLTPWSRVLLEKVNGSAASQEIPRIFGTWRFITVLTSARHLSLSWANSTQSSQPPPTSWISILYLANSLVTAVSEPALYMLLTFHVPKTMSLFRCLLRGASPRNTLPGDPCGGVVYIRIVLSPEEASRLVNIS